MHLRKIVLYLCEALLGPGKTEVLLTRLTLVLLKLERVVLPFDVGFELFDGLQRAGSLLLVLVELGLGLAQLNKC